MIYLYTGSNGSGKTLNAIKFICEELNPNEDRPVFYYSPASKPIGIAEAGVLDWTPLEKDQVINWWDFPEGSIFLIDEVRTIWPYRTQREPLPKEVDLLADHRDRGFDFIFTAQKPTSQFDPAIQGFIEEHRHLEGVGGSAKSRHFVYQSFCNAPQNPTKLQNVQQSTISFDKKYFSYYRSASIHTHKNRLPYKKLLFVAPLPFLFFGLIWIAYSALNDDDPLDEVPAYTDNSFVPTYQQKAGDLPYEELYKPRITGLPHTAPVYDELMEPKQAPKPAACIVNLSSDVCSCHTQQATPLDVPDSICRAIVAHGWFDASIEPLEAKEANQLARGQSGKALATAPPDPPRSYLIIDSTPPRPVTVF